jgi:hypothetical protein
VEQMHILDFIHIDFQALPILARTAVFVAIIVSVPRLCRQLKPPAAVGFLLAGPVTVPSGQLSRDVAPEPPAAKKTESDVSGPNSDVCALNPGVAA